MPSPDDDAHWLDGLSGHPGTGPGHAQGAALREALRDGLHDEAPPMSWEALTRAAGPAPVPVPRIPRPARGGTVVANAPRWLVVACAALAAGVAWQLWPRPATEADTAPMLRGSAATHWQDAQPAEAAARLAVRLREAGLQVQESGDDAGCRRLDAQSAAPERDQALLLSLDLALDGQGRVSVRICPPAR